jgi:hypothetical protein
MKANPQFYLGVVIGVVLVIIGDALWNNFLRWWFFA